jgi:hypothetical protein
MVWLPPSNHVCLLRFSSEITGSLDDLDALTQLTSLALCRGHDAGGGGLPPSAAAAIAPPAQLPGAAQGGEEAGPAAAAGAAAGLDADGRPRDFVQLPAAVGELRLLHTLRLDNLPPCYDALRRLPALLRLEMRVRDGRRAVGPFHPADVSYQGLFAVLDTTADCARQAAARGLHADALPHPPTLIAAARVRF